MTLTNQLLTTLIVLVAVGYTASWIGARQIKTALELSAELVAIKLAASDAVTRAQLADIYTRVNGRLDLALDKVTRLEEALARERGVAPPMPNPLAAHATQPTSE